MNELVSKRTSDYIVEAIANAIIYGKIKGNIQLKQEELAEELGASRIPVREALHVLEAQGLVVRMSNRHIISVELNERIIKETFEIIFEIEKKVILNILNGSICDEFVKVIREYYQKKSYSELEFHFLLGNYVTNNYLENILNKAILCYIKHAIQIKEENMEDNKNKLQDIFESILKQDLNEIKNKLKEYFSSLAQYVINERNKII